jgi:hypothetical protein
MALAQCRRQGRCLAGGVRCTAACRAWWCTAEARLGMSCRRSEPGTRLQTRHASGRSCTRHSMQAHASAMCDLQCIKQQAGQCLRCPARALPTCCLQRLLQVLQALVHIVHAVRRLVQGALRVVDRLPVLRVDQEPAQCQRVVLLQDLWAGASHSLRMQQAAVYRLAA